MQPTNSPITIATNHPFLNTLADALKQAFETPEYSYAATRTTPCDLAFKITTAFLEDHPPIIGHAIKATCKTLKIKPNNASIKAFIIAQNPS